MYIAGLLMYIVHWPDRISNNDLSTITNQEPIVKQIKGRKWSWLEHTLWKND